MKLVSVQNEQPVTTSLVISEAFDKRHDNVLRDIETLMLEMTACESCSDLLDVEAISETTTQPDESVETANDSPSSRAIALYMKKSKPKVNPSDYFILSNYKDSGGRVQPMYTITEEGFALLAMGFTGTKALAFKITFLNEFKRLVAENNRLRQAARLKAETALADMKEKYRQLENYNEDWEKSYQDMEIRAERFQFEKNDVQHELNEANAKLAKMKKPSADERNEIVRKAGDRTLREYKRYLRTEAKGMATEIKYMRAWLKGMGFGGEPTMNRGLCEISDTIGRLANYNMDTCLPLDDE